MTENQFQETQLLTDETTPIETDSCESLTNDKIQLLIVSKSPFAIRRLREVSKTTLLESTFNLNSNVKSQLINSYRSPSILKRPTTLRVKKIEIVDPKSLKSQASLMTACNVEEFNVYKLNSSEIIKLNIGGRIFCTFKSTLTKRIKRPNSDQFYDANLLEEIINATVECRFDENKAIFIDRNPLNFEYILDFLRMANTNAQFDLPSRDILLGLEKDCEYFKIDALKELLLFYDSNILSGSLKQQLIKLCDFKLKQNWRLIYRASQDGFSSANFHAKCDGIANTLTIVKTIQGNVFGGYTEAAWSTFNVHVADPKAFLFSLINKDNKPLIMKCSNPATAIYCGNSYGPTFGEGHDLVR